MRPHDVRMMNRNAYDLNIVPFDFVQQLKKINIIVPIEYGDG